MTPTDTSEKQLENIIVNSLVNDAQYVPGRNDDYLKEYALDLAKLLEFLNTTQPGKVKKLGLNEDGPRQTQFLHRLQGEITKKGVIHVLRNGIKHGPDSLDLYYLTPTPGHTKAEALFAANIFSVTRQLRYSMAESHRALDMCIFINGLPLATFELKNKLTKQTVDDAVQQYRRDRDPREPLFAFKRCAVHFALDDHEVRMCTHLNGKHSWFLPFNKGFKEGAGNPPNPNGIATAYLWEEILTIKSLTDILENYAQVVTEKSEKGRKKSAQVFPRYHQLDVVRHLLSLSRRDGVGNKYLIQHSAGSGKSNSIAWLAHQLVGLQAHQKIIFDSVIVITDRILLDRQIRDTIKQFAQVSAIVGHSESSADLKRFIQDGKKIIITTVQKFPFILEQIGNDHRGRKYAIIIDEAHSSQGGRIASKMNVALADLQEDDVNDYEESIEDKINRIMEDRKMLKNASYFAFTATPKNKTLEIFGLPVREDGKTKHRPIHCYSMKQAIEEGFILDVLKHYTPVNSYYRLVRTIEENPLYDKKKTNKKLRYYVESHDHAIRKKAEIMIDHFHTHVLGHRKIGGKARAMVVTSGIQRAIQYYNAFTAYLQERKSNYKAIVAFSGEHEYGGKNVTESSLNSFPGSRIASKIIEDPYRFLIVADKFQTGYDEPLMHTMYVDKALSGIKAVQTLSRLNRAHPQKHDTFILDFMNNTDTIEHAFSDYHLTTILSEETDPNKLHDIKAELDGHQVYSWEQVEELVRLYLEGEERDQLDIILDLCVSIYSIELEEEEQVEFKGKAKSFCRTYNFLASIIPYSNAEWEKLSIFLNFLIPKLPAPEEEDLSQGILEAIDMDSYRAEVGETIQIALADEDSEIGPVPTSEGSRAPEPELDVLSNILNEFNSLWGNIDWSDEDQVGKIITEKIPEKVTANPEYQNAVLNSDKQNAQIEHNHTLEKVMNDLTNDQMELFKQFFDNSEFRKWLENRIFDATYKAIKSVKEQLDDAADQSFAELIKMKESKRLEFKSSLQWDVAQNKPNKKLRFSVLKTIAAFLNSEGGTLLIGVDDDHNIFGLEKDYQQLKGQSRDQFEQTLTNLIASYIGIEYSQYIEIDFEQIDDKDICRVIVAKSPRPIFLKEPEGKKFYVRANNLTRFLDVEEAMEYKDMHWN
jgi:type I restriction enzyme R subunit